METTCSAAGLGLRWSKRRLRAAHSRHRVVGRDRQGGDGGCLPPASSRGHKEWIASDFDRPHGSERCAGPGRRSPRKPPSGGLRRPAHLFATPCPPDVPPRKSPFPSSDSHLVAPSERPAPSGCCTDAGYLAQGVSQPRRQRVAVGLPGRGPRQTPAHEPLFPPGGECARRHASPPRGGFRGRRGATPSDEPHRRSAPVTPPEDRAMPA